MERYCKLCDGKVKQSHTVKNITYYHCANCNFLQNYSWEEASPQEQQAANEARRAQKWPVGEAVYMREQGWVALELLGWPIAWFSRKLHAALKHVPGYTPLVRAFLRCRFRRLLDFGCGHGTTVLELHTQDGLDTYGLDPYSPTDHPRIHRATIEEASLRDGEFDGIFSIETLEHIPNPLETFQQLHRVLSPGGVLVVQTRRLEDPDYQAHGQDWFYLEDPKTHIHIFSEKAFRRLAKQAGFRSASFKGARLARFVK